VKESAQKHQETIKLNDYLQSTQKKREHVFTYNFDEDGAINKKKKKRIDTKLKFELC